MEQEKLFEAIESIRRDKHDPWRYILFTFLNGIAQGLGMALGLTVVLGIVIWLLTLILSHMINFPVVGYYVGELMKIIDTYIKQGAKVR
ncbi:hypothetical protein A2311_06060 [candidate division WOR-1 bacterium RIFOXYB2_FULL_48_7]|uniref:Uncharacterized protein n=1 Tax=candidate division WOR-1 bacterium RIFOXYB2_FULL_48_7 TaxID=1802583 RepID=A0A1F4TQV9_UNCSA|nr:MAG: hypothetical protein A2311_06060 [candidate division WOR-1 bacterium RIFOXYB2_FULL_48_7]